MEAQPYVVTLDDATPIPGVRETAFGPFKDMDSALTFQDDLPDGIGSLCQPLASVARYEAQVPA